MLNKPLFIVALLLTCATRAFAWGHEGHRIIAGIAQDHLTPAARAEVQRLMGTDQLANFATWADDIRPQRRETAPWHYVNIPSFAMNYDSQRDCLEGDCVVEKLKQFSATLRDARQPLLARREALKWVIHLTGDIHQPFHAIADARGGNDVPIQEVGSPDCGRYPCELHALWDTDMLRHTGLRERRYVLQLEELGEDLDRHVTFQAAIAGAIDLAHTAGTQRGNDLIRVDPGASDKWHSWLEL